MAPQYTPMAPTLVREPFHRAGRVYEEKVDGWRMLAYKDGERVRLVSRNGRDHTRRFADLAAAVGGVKAGGGGAYEGLVAKDERAPGSSQAVDEN